MLIPYFFRFLANNVKRSLNSQSTPFLLNYSVTFRCNLDCKYCGISGLENNDPSQEIGKADIADFFRDRMLKKLEVIVISGGEPFLKEDFNDILMELQRRVSPQIFHITTNGFLTEKIVSSIKFLKKNGLNVEIKISIDDISGGHDRLRNKNGSFDKAVETVKRLRSTFDEKELLIGINQTIFEENYRSIPEVRRLAQKLGAVYRGFVGSQKKPLYTGIGRQDFGLVDLSGEAKEFINNQLREIYGWKSYFRNTPRLSEEIIIKHYIEGQIKMLKGRALKRHKCMCLFTHFRMNPNGDIITCSYDLDVLGNIRQDSYSSIMRGSRVKSKLKKVKDCGRCWSGCEVSPSWVSSLFVS